MELTIGQNFEDYEILGVLGTGGMGKVYKVRNKISDRVEAMKILLSDLKVQPELVERFTREIRIFASLDHPNITELRTALRVDNNLVMIMELVEGSSLDQLMKQGRIHMQTYLGYMCQALSALSYAHGKGVIHRDIKPSNMMVTPTGVLKLMDFGIAKTVTDPQLTKTGFLVGSVHYISPEQIEGKDPDGRADLYSLGVTLYEVATGKRPFDGNSDYQIISAHMKEAPPPPNGLDPTLPAALNDIIMLALEKDPAKRFQTADAFRNALASLIVTPATAAAAPVPVVAPKRNMRLLYMLAGSAATIAVIVGAVIELPKIMHTSAAVSQPDAAKSAVVSDPPPKQSSTAPAAPSPEPTATAQPEPVAAPAGDAKLTPPGAAAPDTAKPAPKPGAMPKPAPPPRQQAQIQPIPAQVVPPVQQQQQQQIAQPVPPPPAQTSAPPPVPPANAAALGELRERANLMSVRLGTIRASFQSLQRQQQASGLSPRSDMVAADQRLGYQMDQAEASLQQGDVAGAKKRLDSAERDLEKLESFLGK